MKPLLTSLLLLATSLSALAVAQEQPSTAPNIKIGAVLPLSGAASNFGTLARRGIELALEDLSPADRARTSVVFEDDGLSNARSATAANKLLNVDKVDLLLTWSSGTGMTVAGISEAKKVPHLSIATDPAIGKGKRYSFTYWPIAEDEAKRLYDHLVKVGVTKVALIYQIHNGILAITDAFREYAAREGIVKIVALEEVSGDTTDFKGVLQRLKAKGEIQGLIPVFFPGQLSVVLKQARGVGINAPFFGFETFEDKDEIKAAGGLLSGAVYATGGDPQADFIKRYLDKYPGESYYTVNQAYDIVKLFVAATKEHKDPESVVSFLKSVKDLATSSGSVSYVDGNRFRLPTALKRINGAGEAEVVE